jgi:hypothetical protein
VPDWSRPIILVLLLLTLAFGLRAFLSTRRARRAERAQSALVNDINVMQSALVPDVPATLGGLSISAAYRPAEGPAAGGDFYDVFALADGRVAIILGDVSGHGHQALNQAALTRYTLRAYLQAGLEPRAALALAGEVMSDPDFEHFATVIAGIYDERPGQLTYASAGHPHPLMLGGPQALGECAAPPLGWGVPTGQRQTVLTLSAHEYVCFFSDGLLEARTQTGLLGRDGLESLLRGLGERPRAPELLAAVQDSATLLADDMAACVIGRATPLTAPGGEHFEELEVDRAALDGDSAERFLEACGVSKHQREATLVQARALVGRSTSARLRVDMTHSPDIEVLCRAANPPELGERTRALRAAIGA